MPDTTITAPHSDEYADYYDQYISKVPPGDFMKAFSGQTQMLRDLLEGIPEGEDNKPHAPYTWTLKQVVGHLLDCERIFSTRMLRIAVGDETPIPGINQDEYVAGLDYTDVTMAALLDEFAALRQSNQLLAVRVGNHALARVGTASGNPVSARANLFILCGHVAYHAEIIRERVAKLST